MTKPAQLLVFDWETTGLNLHPDADVRKQPHAIEFGGALISCADGSVTEELTLLINPGIELEPIITKITGITDAMLRNEPLFPACVPRLSAFFGKAEAMLSHNLPFDKAILLGELARHQVQAFPLPRGELCSVGLYREQWGRNPKLLELYEAVMGKPLAQTHRAMDDVNALVEIVQHEELWRLV